MTTDSLELNEVLVTSESDANLWSVGVWNPWTGSSVATFKGFSVAPKRLVVVDGIIVAAAASEKPLLDVWYLQHKNTERRTIVTPGLVKALATSADGVLLAAAIEEQIAVWNVSSGELLALLRRHYLAVEVVRFSDDNAVLVSGGADSLVLAWDLPSCLSSNQNMGFHVDLEGRNTESRNSLLHTWSGHALSVTDVHVGRGIASLARVASASADRTVRLWDLGTGACLFTFVFEHIVNCILLDPCEYHVYAGCVNGDIVQVALFNAAAPAGSTLDTKTANQRVKKLTKHKARLTTLSISFDGTALASGSEDGNACVWDLRSTQVIRTLAHKSTVTNVHFAFAPYLQCEESPICAKTPIWPQLQKRLKEQEDSYSENTEILHDLVVK